jgi:peroxiredoxin
MSIRKFFCFSLLFAFLMTACDTPQNNNSINSNNSNNPNNGLVNSNNIPTSIPSPQASTPLVSPHTVLKQEEIKLGATLPEITAPDVTGKTTVIASRTDKTGQLLMVYGPSCPVCHATMPNVVNLYSSFFQGNNIPIIALSVQPQAVTELSIKELNIPFKVVVMPDVDLKFTYKVPSIPTLIAVGPDGVIRGLWVGQIGAQQMTEIIKTFCPSCDIEISKSTN